MLLIEELEAILVFGADFANGEIERFFWCSVMGIWEDADFFWFC